MSTDEIAPDTSGYWYDEDGRTARGVEVLNALRDYRAADGAMRKRTRTSMGMGETDLLALRFLLRARREGTSLGPKDLSQLLGISSASTTILLDRLERSGHIVRQPHPTDRRALVIEPTEDADEEVRATLARMHERMIETAESLDEDDAGVVVKFLHDLTDAADSVDPD